MTATHIGIRVGVTLGLAFSVSAVATSSSFGYSARAQQMCMGDAMRLCSSEVPNVSRIISCMRRNKANVSAGCRAVMEQEDPASRPKPVLAAPAEPKRPVTARAEQPAPVKPKPVSAAPPEQMPPAAARAEQPAQVAPKPVAAAPVEHSQTSAPVVAQPVGDETKPAHAVPFEQATAYVPRAEQSQRPGADPSGHLAGQEPVTVSSLVQAAVAAAKLAQLATAEQKSGTATPAAAIETKSVPAAPAVTMPPALVAPPAAVQVRPVQAATAAAKPAEAKSVPVAKPVKVVRRKQKPRQVAVAVYTPREGGGYERYVSMAAPIMSLIMSYW